MDHSENNVSALARHRMPLLVTGVYRAGSAPLTLWLNRYSHSYVSDTALFMQRAANDLSRLRGGQMQMPVSAHTLIDVSRRWIDEVYAEPLRRTDKRRFGDRALLCAPLWAEIDQIFARECLFVWCVRHPIDQVLSCFENCPMPWLAVHFVTPDLPQEQPAKRIMLGMFRSLAAGMRQLAALKQAVGDRVCVVRYEDIASNGAGEYSRVMEFLGESDVGGPRPDGRDLYDCLRNDNVTGLADPTAERSQILLRDAPGRWQSLGRVRLTEMAGAMIEYDVLPLMEQAGYGDAARALRQTGLFPGA